MNKRKILSFLGRFSFAVICSLTAAYIYNGHLSLWLVLISTAIIFIIISFILYIYPYLQAYARLIFTANFRGLWTKNDLHNQVAKFYKRSSTVKIKVTRGHNLFFVESGLFYNFFFNKRFNERKHIKILLHYPCIKSEHILKRSRANQKSINEYTEDLFKVLKSFKIHTNDINQDEDISIKFYLSSEEKEWRYYIFEEIEGARNVIFFNNYSNNIPGAKSNMIKVKSGNSSLGDELNKAFDTIFEDHSVELISNIKSQAQLLNSSYCGHSGCEDKINEFYNKVFKNE